MTASEPRPDPARGPDPRLSCADAQLAIREFLRGGMPTARANDLRAHRKVCAACDTEYRELVQGVATISSGARTVAARATETFAEERGRRSLITADPARKLRIPRMFLPIVLAVLFVLVALRSGAPKPALVLEGGEVWVRSRQIETQDPVELKRFDTCVTGTDGRARLEFGTDVIWLEPASSCLLDRPDGLALRLFEGAARVRGNVRVLLPRGALETQGAEARIAIDERGFAIQATSGTVRFVDGATTSTVAPGEPLRVDVASSTDDAGVLGESAPTDASPATVSDAAANTSATSETGAPASPPSSVPDEAPRR